MRGLIVIALVAMIALIPVAVCYGEEDPAGSDSTSSSPRDGFADWYGQLEMRSGGLWNLETEEWTPYITVPVLGYRDVTLEGGVEIDVDEKTEEKGPNAVILGVTYDLGNLRELGVEVSWAQYFGLNVGPYVRYEFGTRDVQPGIMVSLVDLSFDQGNVEKQSRR